jgi:hypothetical protein
MIFYLSNSVFRQIYLAKLQRKLFLKRKKIERKFCMDIADMLQLALLFLLSAGYLMALGTKERYGGRLSGCSYHYICATDIFS